ncbi:MAG: carbamoyltransferase HypF [Dehalococcoidales bacterium]|nr:carbamoyltransferase HypF [Dehalococcoidales bacterium]
MKASRITVNGIVQGVGFRPFVYRLAGEYGLKGWVRNTSGSVEIEVEGNEISLRDFITELKKAAPPASRIEKVRAVACQPHGYVSFDIKESETETGQYQPVSPDIATCEDCRKEIFTPTDRRYRYSFTNCTNCGPRFTIIEDIPYDRPKTTMRKFKMCPQCQKEYDNPADRRFHAQPNACPVCGPRLELVDNRGKPVKCNDVIKKAAILLKNGEVLAVRGLGGFQLACDATNEKAVDLLRKRKHRPAKPFAVMAANPDEVEKYCKVSLAEAELLASPEAPIVLLKWRQPSVICPSVAPGNKYLGVMLPYTPLHHLLLAEVGLPLIMTSGNLSEEPIAKENDEAIRRLHGIADYFILHNRDIYARYDDSVARVENGTPQIIRRARGYAPHPVMLLNKSKQILACGAEEKNTFCLTRERHAFLSQHIGDLENEETLAHYENTVELYKKLFRIQPQIIAYDMHPEYLATKYALETGAKQNLKMVPVQHHHAHIVSCMVENGVKGPVLGVAFDGTGYGTDGNIWGGEFLLADNQGFQRLGHLENVPLPGGAVAIKKPYRMALSYIYTLLGKRYSLEGLPLTRFVAEYEIIKKQVEKKINTPLTSSAGRLFDAVAALLNIRMEIDYEAQAAIELEMAATDDIFESGSYPFTIACNRVKIVKPGELIEAVMNDIKDGIPVPVISLKFHNTVAEIILQMSLLLKKDTGLNQIALSGGVFQNRLLHRLTLSALQKEGFKVFTHHLVPCNDGGISLGQAVIAQNSE